MQTVQRKLIMSCLDGNKSHPSARDIFNCISKREHGVISYATVYNTLSKMKKEGLIRELAINNADYKRYDPNLSPHAHLICTECGRIEDMEMPLIGEISCEQRHGFDIKNGDVQFYGVCPECNNKVQKQ